MFRMPTSNLCQKLLLAELVETLDENECLDVIGLLQTELGCETINNMVNKIIISNCTNTLTNSSFIKIRNTIKEKLMTKTQNNTKKQTLNRINKTNTQKELIFPLHRLPHDLLLKTSLFLNETDIFNFEQCCRLFYKMINNTSYLSQCNNFKQFIITKKRLHQMKQEKCSFFKYSKANQVSVNLSFADYHRKDGEFDFPLMSNERPQSSLVAALNDFESTMNEMKKMGSYDNWLTSLFKSISILDVCSDTDMGILLSQMPIDILFNPDPNQSHLKQIKFAHCIESDYQNIWKRCMDKFEQEYLDCKKKCEKQGLKIKSLECIKYVQPFWLSEPPTAASNPPCINSKHVWMTNMIVDLTDNTFLTYECNPDMKILTIEDRINFVGDINIIQNRGLKIETLRFLSFRNYHGYDICNDRILINSFNLQNSLKNLTMECKVRYFDHADANKSINQEKALEIILQKKYYYNLENVNIILELEVSKREIFNDISIDWFFQLFEDNEKILKHQFKQLNIAILQDMKNNEILVFEWDNKMNKNRLSQLKHQFYKMRMKSNQQNQTQFKKFEEKYLLMRKQWLD